MGCSASSLATAEFSCILIVRSVCLSVCIYNYGRTETSRSRTGEIGTEVPQRISNVGAKSVAFTSRLLTTPTANS